MPLQLIRNRGRVARVQPPPPPPPKKVKCHGKCKRDKLRMFFRPSDLRSMYPVCRECRKTWAPSPSRRREPAGELWRQSVRHLFVDALVAGRSR